MTSGRKWLYAVLILGLLSGVVVGQQTGYETVGLVSPRGYEAKLSASGALQLTLDAPGTPPVTTPVGSGYNRFMFAYSQAPANALQVDADGKIHVTIAGLVGGGTVAWGDITGTLSGQTDLQAALDAKQAAIAYTTENVANKSTNTSLGSSNTSYPSQLAVKTYVDVADAALTAAIALKEDASVVAGLVAGKEDVSNKSVDGALGTSDTFYPSQKAVKTAVDLKQDVVTWGAGLAVTGATARTASQEAGFVADGGASNLTCGSSTQGKMQVMDDGELQYCDGAATAVLRAGPLTQTGLTWNVTAATCTGDANAGKLTVNGSAEIVCASDITGAAVVAGDVTAIGSCGSGDCFTTAAPSASLKFNNATSGSIVLQTVAGALGTRTISLPAETGTICTTGSVCAGYAAVSEDITSVGSCVTGDCFTPGAPDLALTFKNATSGTITLQTVAGALGSKTVSLPAEDGTVCTTAGVCTGYGDVTAVGSCTTGACFTTGVPGVDLTLTNATSGTVKLQTVAGALGSRTISFPAETGTACTTGSVCTGYQASLAVATANLYRRSCTIVLGSDDASSVLTDANLGPQLNLCMIPSGATAEQITVYADGGTPSIILHRRASGSNTALLSSALSTASSGGIACAKGSAVTGYDGATTCSATLQNTTLAAGVTIGLTSGTAGGVAKKITVILHYLLAS